MNIFFVGPQALAIKGFVAEFTLNKCLLLVSIFHVVSQASLRSERKFTDRTFLCLAFVNILDVILQSRVHSKIIAADFTLEVSIVLMNKFNVPSHGFFYTK